MNLSRLTVHGRALISEEFLRNHRFEIEIPPEFIQEIAPLVDLSSIAELVDETQSKFERLDTRIDGFMAVRLHQLLRLSRKQASDIGIWHWLATAAFPGLVRHRWERKGKVTRERFLGDHVRNAFARLWWGAELLREGTDYEMVNKLFSAKATQDLYEATIGRGDAIRSCQSALRAFVTSFEHDSQDVFRPVAIKFTCLVSTVLVDSLDERQISKLLVELRNTAT